MRNKLTWIMAAAAPLLVAVQANAACSNRTLHGSYAFTISGQILAPPQAAGLVSGVALTVFDGQGGGSQVDHASHNGVPFVEDWRPGSVTYSINPDCTGTMTITPEPTNMADFGPPLHLYIVVTRDGSQVDTVVSNPGTQTTSIGVRRGSWDDNDE